jgi:hypothetical protein
MAMSPTDPPPDSSGHQRLRRARPSKPMPPGWQTIDPHPRDPHDQRRHRPIVAAASIASKASPELSVVPQAAEDART